MATTEKARYKNISNQDQLFYDEVGEKIIVLVGSTIVGPTKHYDKFTRVLKKLGPVSDDE
jgi:hypothetical protein